jgi:alanine-alpha-ketoisovalerate/valine-pyruvate aminotransferase
LKAVELFLFKHHGNAFLSQLLDDGQAVKDISSETADRFYENHIDVSVKRILYHFTELHPFFHASSRDAFVCIYANHLPVGVAQNEPCVILQL